MELGYSEGSAQRRIDGARILAVIPDVGPKIESGKLTLGASGKAASFFRDQEIKSGEEKKDIIDQLGNMSQKDCEKKLVELSGEDRPVPKEKKKRFSTDQTHVSMNLSDETLEKLAKLKSLIGNSMSQDELLNFMAEIAIQKIEKEKFKQTEKPKNTTTVAAEKRYVSAKVKREVYQRDKKCTNCGTLHNLHFDHVKPFALGGASTKENIRLLCFHCNQRSRKLAGL
jgi:NADH pyrophosphatase NudC (nudix superfamily)